ncbi:MAG: TIGR04053 family radical SAM/SPASM domain-containing protein [Ferroplasma sp.]
MIDYNKRPILIFWETTKSCGLACRHCRASAMEEPLPDELSYDEGINFVKSITEFGKPYPILILTGGDMMRKKKIDSIIETAESLGIPVSISPAATDMLTSGRISYFKKHHVLSVSLSLDGNREMHDWLRGKGVYNQTIALIDALKSSGMKMQINSVVMRKNIDQLPDLLKLLLDKDVRTWEVFFLIRTGRAIDSEDLTPKEFEDINQWLAFSTRYGMLIRTVESPIFRRIMDTGNEDYSGELYYKLVDKTIDLLGLPSNPFVPTRGAETRDGKGIIFVSQNGDVYPSGFLPFVVGNVREKSIMEIYRTNETLQKLRDPNNLLGHCGICYWNDSCGGSRARAFSYFNNIFAPDPSCIYSIK